MLIEQSTTETIHYFDFKVEGTRLLDGATLTDWRITTTDQSSQLAREYWVRGSEIFLIDFQARKPWNHATPFVISKRATRISPEERKAVTKAIAHWTPPMTDAAHGGRMKWIREGSYVGVGFRRTAVPETKGNA